jgi:hypothetical protein
LDVDQFYGIEYEEFPARIAEVALWLMDHQMNMLVSQEFGEYFIRIPLKKAANIVIANALQIDWNKLESKNQYNITADVTNVFNVNEGKTHYETLNIYSKTVNINPSHETQSLSIGRSSYDYIFGNPPFIGKSLQDSSQKQDLATLFSGIKSYGVLDYVTAWYLKAAQLIQNTQTRAAFVSTNSISQGEQVGVLWNILFKQYKIKIHFAHRTFSWSNEARGNAAVHVIIIGFANYDIPTKSIFEYRQLKGEPHEIIVNNINPYLVEGKDFALSARTKPICDVPEMLYGNKIVDGGNYLFTDSEKQDFTIKEPEAEQFFKPILSGDEFLNGKKRWVLYLEEAHPQNIRNLKLVMERVKKVAAYRQSSTKAQTRLSASTPLLFAEPRQPKTDFLLIPRTTSENRKYLPLGFFTKDFIVNDSCTALPDATLFHFGILTSAMHHTWTKYICGRLKSDYRYSGTIVYNNFPWPENPGQKLVGDIEKAAQNVLDTRLEFPNSTLADLYDPLAMPTSLVNAHAILDKAVDAAYRPQPFASEAERMEYLFGLYEKYVKHPVHQG